MLRCQFCVVHGVIPDDKLDRARAAWLEAEAPARQRWEEGRAAAAPKNSEERLAVEQGKTPNLAQCKTAPPLASRSRQR